jgi:hypothetical protein
MAKKKPMTAKPAKSSSTRAKASVRAKASDAPKKHVGDVLGLGRARVPEHVPRATKDRGGNPKGIEVGRPRSTRPFRAVGGVRSHRQR